MLTLQCDHIFFLISPPPLKMLEPANPAPSQWIPRYLQAFLSSLEALQGRGILGAHPHQQRRLENTVSIF